MCVNSCVRWLRFLRFVLRVRIRNGGRSAINPKLFILDFPALKDITFRHSAFSR
jgi:hypothetical protein